MVFKYENTYLKSLFKNTQESQSFRLVTHSQTDCNENQLDIRVEGFATSYLIREIQTPLARSD